MNREDVIKGLECCKKGAELNDGYIPVIRDCAECPYLREKVPCTRALARDALALIKEQKHGRWIGLEYDGYADGYPVYDVWECSECGEEWNGEETPNYCPNCGARMEVVKYDN